MKVRTVYLLLTGLVALVAPMSLAAAPMTVKAENGTLCVRCGDQVLLKYCYDHVPFKPYLQQFFSPAGINVLRDAVPDHIHHHGLMFALSVDTVDFWSETETSGCQVQRSIDVKTDARDSEWRGRFTQALDWMGGPGHEALLQERRTIELVKANDVAPAMLTWESILETPKGRDSVTLSGAHYVGLGMRFLECMDRIGRFFNASGQPGEIIRGEERNVPANWCAYAADVEGKPVTVAMFDAPDNPRRPTTWFTMPAPFAYMSATLDLHKEPLKIVAGKPLILRYGVALWDGTVEPDAIEKQYQAWLTRLR